MTADRCFVLFFAQCDLVDFLIIEQFVCADIKSQHTTMSYKILSFTGIIDVNGYVFSVTFIFYLFYIL